MQTKGTTMSIRNELQSHANKYRALNASIICSLEKEIKRICDKWELKFYAGMGVFGFNFSEDTELVECIEMDGEEYTREIGTKGDDLNDDYILNLLKESELSELYEDLNTFLKDAYELADDMNRTSEYYLSGCDDYDGGFRYNNGYEKHDRKTKYYTDEAKEELNNVT